MSEQNIKKLYVSPYTGDLWLATKGSSEYVLDNGNGVYITIYVSPEEHGLVFIDYFLEIPAPQSKLQKIKQFFKEVFQEL